MGIQSGKEPGGRDARLLAMPCLTVTAGILVAVVVPMITHLVAVAVFAVTRGVVITAIAMIEALRLRGGHAQSQCGNECQCKQFFEHLSLLGKW
jgi:hypothetical protein